MADDVPFKCSLGEETRRFSLPVPVTVRKLKEKISDLFGVGVGARGRGDTRAAAGAGQ